MPAADDARAGWPKGCRTTRRRCRRVKKVEVLPGSRVLNEPGPLAAARRAGHFADGSVRDVTRLTVFTSSDTAIADVNAERPGRVQPVRRGRHPVPLPRRAGAGPPDLPRAEAGLRLANPPENNYVDKHVFAKLKMLNILPSDLCTDQEFVRRAYLDVCGILPTPDEVDDVPRQQGRRQAGQADRRAARAARVRRLLDAEVVRRASAARRKTIQVKGTHVFQNWLRNHIDKNTGFDADRARSDHRQRQHLRQPAGQLLPHRPRPAEPGRDDRPALLRHPHAVRQVPQPPVRALDAGRLLQHGRVLRPREAAEATRSSRRRPAERRTAPRSSTSTAAARSTQPRTGKVMAAEVHGRRDRRRSPPGKDRREVLADWLTVGGQPVLRRSRSSTASGST